jgi:hypothetical protein
MAKDGQPGDDDHADAIHGEEVQAGDQVAAER